MQKDIIHGPISLTLIPKVFQHKLMEMLLTLKEIQLSPVAQHLMRKVQKQKQPLVMRMLRVGTQGLPTHMPMQKDMKHKLLDWQLTPKAGKHLLLLHILMLPVWVLKQIDLVRRLLVSIIVVMQMRYL